jgi:hypothetical protein
MNADESPHWPEVERQAVSLIDKGILLTGPGDHAGAFASFDKAVSICRRISDKSDPVALILAQALDNKARSLIDLGRSAEAVPCFDEARDASFKRKHELGSTYDEARERRKIWRLGRYSSVSITRMTSTTKTF